MFPGYIFDNIIGIYNIGLINNCSSPFACSIDYLYFINAGINSKLKEKRNIRGINRKSPYISVC